MRILPCVLEYSKCLSLFFLVVCGSVARGESQPTTVARWNSEGDAPTLAINVADLLTSAQREIVNSGFSTFTAFAFGDDSYGGTRMTSVPDVICSVKYDPWEDRYDIIRLSPVPILNETIKEYKIWTNLCLEIVIKDPIVIAQLEKEGVGTAILRVRQSTPDEGNRIKNWLLKQQSGFMQGLYAHMLGDFELRQRMKVKVTIPARPKDKRVTR